MGNLFSLIPVVSAILHAVFTGHQSKSENTIANAVDSATKVASSLTNLNVAHPTFKQMVARVAEEILTYLESLEAQELRRAQEMKK